MSKKLSRLIRQVMFGSADKPVIYALIDRWQGGFKQLIAVLAFIVLFSVFGWQPTMVVGLLISMYLHEWGHAAHFMLNKIQCSVLFSFPLGAVAAPATQAEDQKSDQLPWYRVAHLLQAGPMVNVGLMALSALLVPILDGTLEQFGKDLIYVNALLVFGNIIPIWNFDAGQLFKLIYSSVREKDEKLIAVPFLLIPFAFVVWYLFGTGAREWWQVLGKFIDQAGVLLVVTAIAFSIWQAQSEDKPEHAGSPQAMNARQVVIQLLLYWAQVLVALWIMTQASGL